ncbi:MAG: hypothetical protein ACJAYG_000459 [Oceanicoccus sp.]|jgi:hypothetical protein
MGSWLKNDPLFLLIINNAQAVVLEGVFCRIILQVDN